MIVSDSLWFWRGICGIFLHLSRRVRFCCVLHSFFSDGLYSLLFRSVYFWNNLISVYSLCNVFGPEFSELN